MGLRISYFVGLSGYMNAADKSWGEKGCAKFWTIKLKLIQVELTILKTTRARIEWKYQQCPAKEARRAECERGFSHLYKYL